MAFGTWNKLQEPRILVGGQINLNHFTSLSLAFYVALFGHFLGSFSILPINATLVLVHLWFWFNQTKANKLAKGPFMDVPF